MNRFKRFLRSLFSVLISIFLIFSVMPAGSVFGETTTGQDTNQAEEKPAQSDTEFVVAIDSEFVDQLIPELEEQTAKNPKKVPPGLLKKALEGKKVHVRNLERYQAKHMGDDLVLVVVEVDGNSNLQEARAAAEKCDGVIYTDPLAYFYADEFNDPRVSEQWGLIPSDAHNAWNGNSGLSGITIAILDTGVRLTHEDLVASIVSGRDFIGNDLDPSDEHGHGTHVAGIAAALCNNGKGIASPAGGAKIMPVRVLNADGSGDVLGISDGIRFAADKGADIINLSLGGSGDTTTMRRAIEYAQSKGCLIVASAGNNNSTNRQYPASHDGVIIAASLSPSPGPDYPYAESYFSNYNNELAYRTIHAPGEGIISSYYKNDSSYTYMSGTSMSAPLISGMAAAIKAKGNYSGSLYDAILDASVTMPRAKLGSSGAISQVSGDMKVLNDDGEMDLPNNFSGGRLKLTVTPRPTYSRTVQARVETTNKNGNVDTTFNGNVNVCFTRQTGFYIPKFGSPVYTTHVQPVEIKNGIGTVQLDLAGYNLNDSITLWASDPSKTFEKSMETYLSLYSATDFVGCNVDITVDKPDNYTGTASLPTGSDKYEIPVYMSYYRYVDGDEPPPGMSSVAGVFGVLKWDPVKQQYRGTINLPRGKVQLYYYVYYNGSDKRYPYPQPIGEPIILTSDGASVTGKLLPYDIPVTFQPNGGEPQPETQILPSGGIVTEPPSVNKEGYTFKGWYSTPDFSGAAYDFSAPVYSPVTLYAKWEQDVPNCRIGQKVYNTLSEAIAAAKSGDTITLLSDILYRDTLNITNKKITFDLNGYILDAVYIRKSEYDSGNGIYVNNGEVRLTGAGELNVRTTGYSGYGVRAINSIVEVTSALGDNNSYGVYASDKSNVSVHGDASGLTGVWCTSGSLVTVYGDAVGLVNNASNRTMGVDVRNSEVIVYGDVIANDALYVQEGKATIFGSLFGSENAVGSGIYVGRGGDVTVYGNVTSGIDTIRCNSLDYLFANVTVHGDVNTLFYNGVAVRMGYWGTDTVTINGTVNAPNFARLFDEIKNASDFLVPTLKPGYKTYKATKGIASTTLFVRDPGAPAPVLPESVDVSPKTMTLELNATKQLTAIIAPENADDKTITWTSSNTTIATVSSTGLVTARGAGKATITARTVNGLLSSSDITVNAPVIILPSSITISQTAATLNINETKQLLATITPADADDKKITWTSSNTAVATVSGTGLVTAKAVGTAIITAKTVNDLTATCNITIDASATILPTNITFSAQAAMLSISEVRQLTPTITPANVTEKTLTWTSSNTSVATVTQDGLVTAKAVGSATITAKTVNGLTATCSVSVQLGRTQSFSFTNKGKAGESFNNSMNVSYNGQATITAPGLDSKTSLTVSIKNPSGIEVFKDTLSSGTSKSVAVVPGNHTVTTKIDSASGNISVKVDIVVVESYAPPPQTVLPTGVTVSQASATLDLNSTLQLTATVAPANASDKTVTWTSSNTSVATVSAAGLVTAKVPGTAVITAKTSNNLTATCAVTVKEAPPLPPQPPAPVTLLTVNNASYGNKDAAKSHEFQVNAAGNISISLSGGKNDTYKITLKLGGDTLATAASANGSAVISYNAEAAGKYSVTIERTSSGNTTYSLVVSQ